MRGKLFFIVAAIVVLIGAFFYIRYSSPPVPVVVEHAPSQVVVPFTPLVSGMHAKITDRTNFLITSASELSELWKMLDATTTAPKIDFTSNAVLAVFAGNEPSGGYAITVAKVQDAAQRLVSIVIKRPDTTCVTTQALTAPYELVQVPVTSLSLIHQDRVSTTTCQ